MDLQTEQLDSLSDRCILDLGSMPGDEQTAVRGKVTHGNLGIYCSSIDDIQSKLVFPLMHVKIGTINLCNRTEVK